MVEHDEKSFEHGIEEKLKKLDEQIKVPEIPDAQSIFEKAESEKTNAVPFKKYSKYVACAAAVVLICVSVPVFGKGLSGGFDMAESAAEPMEMFVLDETEAQEPVAEEKAGENSQSVEAVAETEIAYSSINGNLEDGSAGISVKEALESYFREKANKSKDNSAASSSMVIENEESETDDVSLINEKLNKKRSIEITVEKGSVSVILSDNSAGEEIISAFWVEGSYESSYLDGDYYVINLVKTVSEEEFENNYYLPMVGDALNGNYVISEESVFVAEDVAKGAISLVVEINVATGEYQIYAILV